MSELANDTVTGQALARLEANAQTTVDRLLEAVTAERRVRDYAKAAQTRPLRGSDLDAIMTESLRAQSAIGFAQDHNDVTTGIIAKIHKHREEGAQS